MRPDAGGPVSPSGSGLGLALLSAATFGTAGVFATSLIGGGWSPGAAVLARLLVAALALTGPALLTLRGRWAQLRRSAGPVTAYGMFAVAGCQLCYFNALSSLSVGVALLLEYSATVLVVAWLWLRHGQRPRPLTVAGAAVAVVGLVLVLDVLGGARVDLVGVLWGLGAAVGLGSYFVLSSGRDDAVPPVVMACAGMWVGAAALLVAGGSGALLLHGSTADVGLLGHRVSWLVPVLGLSLLAAALAYVTGIAAARLLGPTLSSFVGLTEVLFAVVLAWVLLDQVLAPVQVVGGAVVLAGVGLVRYEELRRAAGPAKTVAAAGRDEHP